MNFIYFLKKNNKVVYVGRTTNIERRMHQHKSERKKDFDSYEIFKEIDDLKKAKRAEDLYIKKYDCEYNRSLNEYGAYISFLELMSKTEMNEIELEEKLFRLSIRPIFKDNYKAITLNILLGEDIGKRFKGVS